MNLTRILEFDDYRDFLHLLVDEKKQLLKNRFSFQIFSKSLDLSKSYLKMVIDKKRHISIERIFQISNYFKLSNVENQYFIFLFLKNTSKNQSIISFFDTILQTYRIRWASDSFNHEKLPHDPQALFYSFQWLQMSLSEILALDPLGMTVSRAHEILGGDRVCSTEDIHNALLKLQEIKMVTCENGRWITHFGCRFNDPSPWDLEEVKKFKTGTKRAELAIDMFENNEMHVPSRYHIYCMALSKANMAEVIKLYDEFELKLQSIARREQSKEDVLFVSNNVFSIVKKDFVRNTQITVPNRAEEIQPLAF